MSNTIEPEIFPTAAAVAEETARAIAARISDRSPGSVLSVMLAGGTTPRAAYERLAAMRPPFDGVDFYFGDERAVAAEDPDSNYRMAREALFDPAGIDPARVHRMLADMEDLEAAARAYAAILPAKIDVLVLGVGEDAHTASLFPGSAAIDEDRRSVVPVVGPKPPPRRLTITRAVIETAVTTLVLVTGAGKADALVRAITAPFDPKAIPIQLARRGRFLVDRDAASKLPTRETS